MPTQIQQRARPFAAVLVGVPVLAAAAISAFAWPIARTGPGDLPVGVTGTVPQVRALEQHLRAQPGAFRIHRYADEQSARAAIEQRRVYGVFVASAAGPKLLLASAASPAVTQVLEQALGQPQPKPSLAVVDIDAAPPADPHGLAFGVTILPLTLVSAIAAIIVMLVTRPGRSQLATLLAAAVTAGLTVTAIIQSWLGIITGPWIADAAALALLVAAVAATVAGLTALLGRAGLALSIAIMVFAGNPWSAAPLAPQLYPKPIGLIGQLLPPGAGNTLLRNTAFFDGNSIRTPLAILCTWAAAGLLAILAGHRLRRQALDIEADIINPIVGRHSPRAGSDAQGDARV